MFRFDDKCDPRQISLTGVRAIVILALLNVRPCSFEEIRDFLIESNIANRSYSIDTIRIDLNTLKYIDCKISRATKSTNNKYVLKDHPFELVLTDEDIETLRLIYKNIYKNLSIDRLLEYDALFTKLSNAKITEEQKEVLRGISILKSYDNSLVEELLKDSKKHNKLTIQYATTADKDVEYEITVEKLGLRSDKLYIYCYNHSMNKRTFLKFSKLKQVLARTLRGEFTSPNDVIVEFKLKNYEEYNLEDYETITKVEGSTAYVKGSYYNDFIALQRVLSFGADSILISPVELRKELIEKLKGMRAQYD